MALDSTTETKEPKGKRSAVTDPRPEERVFIAPSASTQYLVWRGELPPGVTNPNMLPEGYAAFAPGGLCTTRDARVIEWLEAHATPDVDIHALYHKERGEQGEQEQFDLMTNCPQFNFARDRDDPTCAAWSDIETRKLNTANAENALPPDYSFEKLLAGEQPTGAAPMVGQRR